MDYDTETLSSPHCFWSGCFRIQTEKELGQGPRSEGNCQDGSKLRLLSSFRKRIFNVRPSPMKQLFCMSKLFEINVPDGSKCQVAQT